MPLKPMDQRNGLDSRQAIWEALRRLGTATTRAIREETLLTMDSVRDYLNGLAAAGYVERQAAESSKPGSPITWRLVRDIGVEAPRVRRDGTPVTQGKGRENMWQVMRILRRFTVRELAVAARTPECMVEVASAAEYCRYLCLAGYLKKLERGYMMRPTAFTGPRAPMIQRKRLPGAEFKPVPRVCIAVWDPNRNRLKWQGGVSDDE